MKKIILLRHSTTDFNKEMKMLGNSDIPLNEEGIELVHKIKLNYKGQGIQGIITSDLLRSVQTARIISDYLDVPLFSSEKLRERNQGVYEGLTLEEILMVDSNFTFTSLGEGREPVGSFMKRVNSYFINVVNDLDWNCYMVVSHNGVLRMLMASLFKKPIHNWGLCESRVVFYDERLREWRMDDGTELS